MAFLFLVWVVQKNPANSEKDQSKDEVTPPTEEVYGILIVKIFKNQCDEYELWF